MTEEASGNPIDGVPTKRIGRQRIIAHWRAGLIGAVVVFAASVLLGLLWPYTVTIDTAASNGKTRPTSITTPRSADTAEMSAPPATADSATPGISGISAAGTVPTTTVQPTVPSECAIMPVRGFGKVYQENSSVRQEIGCPVEPERGLQMSEQSFEHGNMLRRADTATIYVLRSDGHWSSLPDSWVEGTPSKVDTPPSGRFAPERGFGKAWHETPGLRDDLGWALAPARDFTGAVQAYEHGLMFWSDARWITVLYADGTWERYPDTFSDATPQAAPLTPAAVPQPPAGITPGTDLTATTSISETAPVTVTASAGCSNTTTGVFGKLYDSEARVRDKLGCPSESQQAVAAAEEDFLGGTMYWRGDVGRVYVLQGDGTWTGYPDTWVDGDPSSGGETPPPWLYAPVRGFGKIWRENPQVRAKLGWAKETEHGMQGQVQAFARGLMLWSDRNRIYVLYNDGTWERF